MKKTLVQENAVLTTFILRKLISILRRSKAIDISQSIVGHILNKDLDLHFYSSVQLTRELRSTHYNQQMLLKT